MFGKVERVTEKLPKLSNVVEKQHPAIGAEESEPLKDRNRQPQESGESDAGSGEELRPGGPPETSDLEKCVVEPHV